jgi:hypothetical protein
MLQDTHDHTYIFAIEDILQRGSVHHTRFCLILPLTIPEYTLLFILQSGLGNPTPSNASTMSIFSYIRSIYALDTIDTRFAGSSKSKSVDPRISPAVPNSPKGLIRDVRAKTDNGQPVAQPSKWNTPEFYVYYFVFIITVPYMFWIAYDVSRRQYSCNTLSSISDWLCSF